MPPLYLETKMELCFSSQGGFDLNFVLAVRDIHTSNEVVICNDGLRRRTTSVWLDFVQGTARARMRSVRKVVMPLSVCVHLLKYLVAAAGSER